MSLETITNWCDATILRAPHPYYCTGSSRFGPWCYDCSGFTYMAYKADGKTIPADSSLVARWGRANEQVRTTKVARLGDLLVHDKYNDPYNSTGSRGHIGIFIRYDGSRIITYESASSQEGTGVYSRAIDWWAISVRHPVYATSIAVPPPIKTTKKDEMIRIIKGDKAPEVWVTNWLEKRYVGSPAEINAIIQGGITDGAGQVNWPQAWVDAIPVKKSDL